MLNLNVWILEGSNVGPEISGCSCCMHQDWWNVCWLPVIPKWSGLFVYWDGGRISRIYYTQKKVRGGPRADRDKWSYEAPCKWPYKWVTGVMNLVNEVTYTCNWFFGAHLEERSVICHLIRKFPFRLPSSLFWVEVVSKKVGFPTRISCSNP